MASVGIQKFITPMNNMNSAGVLTFEAVSAASYYGLRPFEAVFNGDESNGDRPVWSFGVTWLLPQSLREVAVAFSLRDVVRRNKGEATSERPTIKLWENFIQNGEVSTRFFVKKLLSTSEMKSVSFVIE